MLVEVELALDRITSLILQFSAEYTLGDADVLRSMAEASAAPCEFAVDITNVVIEGDGRLDDGLIVCLLALSGEDALGDGDFIGRLREKHGARVETSACNNTQGKVLTLCD